MVFPGALQTNKATEAEAWKMLCVQWWEEDMLAPQNPIQESRTGPAMLLFL